MSDESEAFRHAIRRNRYRFLEYTVRMKLPPGDAEGIVALMRRGMYGAEQDTHNLSDADRLRRFRANCGDWPFA